MHVCSCILYECSQPLGVLWAYTSGKSLMDAHVTTITLEYEIRKD